MANDQSRTFLLREGRIQPADGPALAATDRGFTLGDGVFETLRTVGGRPFLLTEHLARLHDGLRLLGIRGVPSDAELGMALTRAALTTAPEGETVLRLTISRGPATVRGLLPEPAGPPTVAVQASPLPCSAEEMKGLHLIIATPRRNEGSPLSRIKSCNYLDNVLARQEAAAAGADEAVLLNNRGEVACACAANIFWLDTAGDLVTPPLVCGVLAGVTRSLILQLAEQLDLPWHEEAVSVRTMQNRAREAFLTNSILGLQPVVTLAGGPVGSGEPGPVTRRLGALYASVIAAQAGSRHQTAMGRVPRQA